MSEPAASRATMPPAATSRSSTATSAAPTRPRSPGASGRSPTACSRIAHAQAAATDTTPRPLSGRRASRSRRTPPRDPGGEWKRGAIEQSRRGRIQRRRADKATRRHPAPRPHAARRRPSRSLRLWACRPPSTGPPRAISHFSGGEPHASDRPAAPRPGRRAAAHTQAPRPPSEAAPGNRQHTTPTHSTPSGTLPGKILKTTPARSATSAADAPPPARKR